MVVTSRYRQKASNVLCPLMLATEAPGSFFPSTASKYWIIVLMRPIRVISQWPMSLQRFAWKTTKSSSVWSLSNPSRCSTNTKSRMSDTSETPATLSRMVLNCLISFSFSEHLHKLPCADDRTVRFDSPFPQIVSSVLQLPARCSDALYCRRSWQKHFQWHLWSDH